jgi:hypothetical protein
LILSKIGGHKLCTQNPPPPPPPKKKGSQIRVPYHITQDAGNKKMSNDTFSTFVGTKVSLATKYAKYGQKTHCVQFCRNYGKIPFCCRNYGKITFCCRNYGKVAFLLSELWEPIRRNYGNLFFLLGIVGKSRFSSFLTLLSEFWEPSLYSST